MSLSFEIRDDILIFDSAYGVIICKLCQYALVPREIANHLQAQHQKDEGLTTQQIKAISDHCVSYPCRHPAWIKEMPMSPDTPAIPFLRLYQGGFCCRLCPITRPYVCLTEDGLLRHLKEVHQWSRPQGCPSATKQATSGLQTVVTFPIAFQTFFRRNLFIRYFPVQAVPGSAKPPGQSAELDSDPAASSGPGQQHFSQVSPWLDTTQWTRYLKGHDLLQTARLIEIPSSLAVRKAALDGQGDQSEYHLLLLLDSFDRVIEQARSSLLGDKVNDFDQHRVNSSIPRRSSSWPLWHKLKEPTYRGYKKVWKQLLCSLYRLVWQKQAPVLHCRLTSAQSTALETVLRAAASLSQQQESAESDDTAPKRSQKIDRACLLLCITLLDHPLHGNIYDSVIVGFLAVLGINP
ncbi:hypothetical protein B0J14DRAFT_687285 [Halenospora varia]|nr:hypothetical protein B0J14DRAFT_687285 [Halenospora varia]